MKVYHTDPTVPFWRSNIDVEELFSAHSHRPERAKAWLDWRYVESPIADAAVMMRGNFELGLLGCHTYHWTFTPGCKSEMAIVLPVFEDHRLVDLLAIARHDHSIWGCVTGAGRYIGSTLADRNDCATPLKLYRTPITWLLNNCAGILPLSKSFFPSLQQAVSILADGYDHALEIAEFVFLEPAERLGLDCKAAEEAALDKIAYEVDE